MIINNVTFKIVEQNKCINYEFDEQSLAIQNIIVPNIPESSFEEWFK